jgi:hypothetical protein
VAGQDLTLPEIRRAAVWRPDRCPGAPADRMGMGSVSRGVARRIGRAAHSASPVIGAANRLSPIGMHPRSGARVQPSVAVSGPATP